MQPTLDAHRQAEIRSAVRPLAEELDLDARLEEYAANAWIAPTTHPALHLDDVSGIPFLVEVSGIEGYQHRARTRAGQGDLFAAVTPATPGYEHYCRERLGLGEVEFVLASPVSSPIEVARACAEGEARKRLAARARAAAGLVIHPYMGIEPVWRLAKVLADSAGVRVSVLAPPPPVTWIANDKGHFSRLVATILGDDCLVETHVSRRVPELVDRLLDVAGRHPRVALKRLRCASGLGNAIYSSAELVASGPASVDAEVRDFLRRTEWQPPEEVMVVAWEENAISPSTQCWIPPLASGRPPRLDGIYEQILEGPKRVFVGSHPSRLPERVHRRLAETSLELTTALQSLGYVGRCSFDYLVVGDPAGDFGLRLAECNGRWGGTSTPMVLVDRLVPGPRPPYRAQNFADPALVGVSFAEILDRVGEEVYDPASGRGRFIFYNVGPLAEHGKLDVVALGETQAAAEAALKEELPQLLGL